MFKTPDYRVVIGIDFGTTYSGFAYAHKKNSSQIYVKADWEDNFGKFKVPTVLLYDEYYTNVESWGVPALAPKPSRKKKKKTAAERDSRKPVELFKLYLGKITDKPALPKGFDYKKAITDYLRELSNVIKPTISNHWDVNFHTQVLLIMTVPAEFDNNAMSIMRECAYKAGLTSNKLSRNLKITTEPEAAAIHCLKNLKEHNLSVNSNFMVVDCGGGTVDLTSRQLLEGGRLSEITERTGDFCGGSYVDKEFVKYLERKVGSSAINLVTEKHYAQFQYMVQEFCRQIKVKFTGDRSEFRPVELDLDEVCPVLEDYCNGDYRDKMENDEWTITLTFDDVKKMFDPVIEKIINLIDSQLRMSSNCDVLFLVGGFSESKYLQSRVRQEFSKRVKLVSMPPNPVVAVIKGAVEYGLEEEIVTNRVLKWNYGTDVAAKWKPGDPIDRRRDDGRIIMFEKLASRGTQCNVNEKITNAFTVCDPSQRKMGLDLYATQDDNAKYCDEPSVRAIGKWSIELPPSLHEEDERSVQFSMTFGEVEVRVTASTSSQDFFETSFDTLEY